MKLPFRHEVVCQQVVELVTAYLEGALPHRLHRAIDHHLAGCPHCTEYVAQMRRSIELTGELRDDDVPDDVLDRLQDAFEEYQG